MKVVHLFLLYENHSSYNPVNTPDSLGGLPQCIYDILFSADISKALLNSF